MAEPYVMASTTWGTPPMPPVMDIIVDSLTTSVDRKGNLVAMSSTLRIGDTVAIRSHTVNPAGSPLSGAQVFMNILDPNGGTLTALQGFTDSNGYAIVNWKSSRK